MQGSCLGKDPKIRARMGHCSCLLHVAGQSCAGQRHRPPWQLLPCILQAMQHTHLTLLSPAVVLLLLLQETPTWGYDLTVALQQVSGLPVAGHPFLLIRMHLGGREEQYRRVACWKYDKNGSRTTGQCHNGPGPSLDTPCWTKARSHVETCP